MYLSKSAGFLYVYNYVCHIRGFVTSFKIQSDVWNATLSAVNYHLL
jgi:hypothetical protein